MLKYRREPLQNTIYEEPTHHLREPEPWRDLTPKAPRTLPPKHTASARCSAITPKRARLCRGDRRNAPLLRLPPPHTLPPPPKPRQPAAPRTLLARASPAPAHHWHQTRLAGPTFSGRVCPPRVRPGRRYKTSRRYRSCLFWSETGMFRRTSATRAGSTSATTMPGPCSLVAKTVPQGSTIELWPHAWYFDSGFLAGEAVMTKHCRQRTGGGGGGGLRIETNGTLQFVSSL